MEKHTRPRTRRGKSPTTCQDCNQLLTDDNWTPSCQKYKRYSCKTCWVLRQKNYAKNNPDHRLNCKLAARVRASKRSPEEKEADRKKAYGRWVDRKYGISLSEYEDMEKEQDYKCFLCDRPPDSSQSSLHVDHCHNSGRVRKLLCMKCNMMLGLVEESVEVLARAIDYLNKHKETNDE